MVLNYVGQEKKDGILKPKFTVSFNLEMQCFSSDIIQQIVTTINVMSLDDRWIIVADKKIIRRALSVRRDTLPLCTGELLLIFFISQYSCYISNNYYYKLHLLTEFEKINWKIK